MGRSVVELMTEAGWSAPDAHGIATLALDVGAQSTLRGRRRRKRIGARLALDALPAAERELLRDWLSGAPARRKWDTLLRAAGSARVELAHSLLEYLLRRGQIEIEETRQGGRWLPLWVEFCAPQDLCRRLGLPDALAIEAEWQAVRAHVFADARVRAAAVDLDALPAARALVRHRLLGALGQWIADGCYGTRRDFSLLARGDTKAISNAEWKWLESRLDLAALGIERHAPLLLVRAPLALETPGGQIALGAAPDFIGLSTAAIAHASALSGGIGCWRLVENRTSFERAASAHGSRDAVLWLPGFAPVWWREAVARLVRLCPAPAQIACDPDPAGIEIALQAGAVWEAAGLPWQPWRMTPADLAALPSRKPLAANDPDRIEALLRRRELPRALAELAAAIRESGEKGEQEGLI